MELIRKTKITITKNDNKIQWAEFLCSISNCNKIVERPISNGLKAKSCGCNINNNNNYAFRHGGSYTRLYRIWKNIKGRCLNLNLPGYRDYGGRGITICPEWLEFIPFRDWSLSNGYQEGLEIDRRDNNGNYEPLNCRWVTHEVNCNNRRKLIKNKITLEIANEIRIKYNSGYYTQQQLGKEYSISQMTISNIINNKVWRKDEQNKMPGL